MSNDDDSTDLAKPAARKSRKWLILFALLGLAIVVGIRYKINGRATDVTDDLLKSAIATWEKQRPANYRLKVRIKGPRTGTYSIEVKDHEVDNYSFNDQPLTNERTKQTWTGRGMLRFLEWDLETQKNLEKDGIQLMVRAEFDSQYGLPFKYQRLDFSTRQSISWEVTEFTPLD